MGPTCLPWQQQGLVWGRTPGTPPLLLLLRCCALLLLLLLLILPLQQGQVADAELHYCPV